MFSALKYSELSISVRNFSNILNAQHAIILIYICNYSYKLLRNSGVLQIIFGILDQYFVETQRKVIFQEPILI